MNLNRELHEALGYCWHEIVFDPLGKPEFPFCKHCKKEDVSWHWEYPNGHCKRVADNNPDYVADPWLVIREMEKRGELEAFSFYVWDRSDKLRYIASCLDIIRMVAIDTTGKLAQLALDWLRKEG